jgi:hypothetical protein
MDDTYGYDDYSTVDTVDLDPGYDPGAGYDLGGSPGDAYWDGGYDGDAGGQVYGYGD